MAESANLLVEDVLIGYPTRQWVSSLPIPLKLILARYPKELSKAMQIIHRTISTDIIHLTDYLKSKLRREQGSTFSVLELRSAPLESRITAFKILIYIK